MLLCPTESKSFDSPFAMKFQKTISSVYLSYSQLSISYQPVINELSAIYIINESLGILFYDLYTVLANWLIRASLRTLSVY